MRPKTRASKNIDWIERYCRRPAGPLRGQKVMLTFSESETIRRLYDQHESVAVSGELAAFLVLLHLCGYEHHGEFPPVATDTFTVWNATSDPLKDVLKREGEAIRCPELGTQFPPQSEAA